MDDRFFNAIFPGRTTVCGRRLTTFSTYHYTLLAAIGSPLIEASASIQPKDLLAAICACRHRYGAPVDLRPDLRDFWWKWRMERDRHLFEREFRRFDRWMESHASVPRYWQIDEGGPKMRELTGPRALIPVTTAMMRLGIPEAQAWNMSMGKIQWYCAQASELDGAERRFYDEEDAQASADALATLTDELPPEEIAIQMMAMHYASEGHQDPIGQARIEFEAMKQRTENGCYANPQK